MTDSTVLYIYIYVHRDKSLGLMNCKRLPTSSENVRSDTFFVASKCHWKKISRQTRGLLHRTTGLGNKQTNSACESIAKD